MNRYICTFGANQEHEGKYVLVIASDIEAARNKMFEEYGNQWCMCYGEDQWNDTPSYIPKETILRTIVVEEEKEKIYCVGCNDEAKYKCCNEEYCYDCLCEIFKDDIIKHLERKYSMFKIEEV